MTGVATTDGRTPDAIRHEIELERQRLASAVEQLREGLGEATDLAGKLRGHLAAATAGAFVGGFVLAGGIGATMRFLARLSRER